MTLSTFTLQKLAIFSFRFWSTGSGERAMIMSGTTPFDPSSRTACWVGLVFISPTDPGTGR